MKATVGCPDACDPAAPPGARERCDALKAARKVKSHLVPVPRVDLPLGATDATTVERAALCWLDALQVLALRAVDPWEFGGAALAAGHGPVCE